MRSGITSWSIGSRRSTPRTAIVAVPAPEMRAPMPLSARARSVTSGSQAALVISVDPSAVTAAIKAFSVPVTVCFSKWMRAPRSLPDRAVM